MNRGCLGSNYHNGGQLMSTDAACDKLNELAAEVFRQYLAATDERQFVAANRLHWRYNTILDCLDLVRQSDRKEEVLR